MLLRHFYANIGSPMAPTTFPSAGLVHHSVTRPKPSCHFTCNIKVMHAKSLSLATSKLTSFNLAHYVHVTSKRNAKQLPPSSLRSCHWFYFGFCSHRDRVYPFRFPEAKANSDYILQKSPKHFIHKSSSRTETKFFFTKKRWHPLPLYWLSLIKHHHCQELLPTAPLYRALWSALWSPSFHYIRYNSVLFQEEKWMEDCM